VPRIFLHPQYVRGAHAHGRTRHGSGPHAHDGRRRASRREEDTERQRLQLAADRAFCDIRAASRFAFAVGNTTGGVDPTRAASSKRGGATLS
jgi:hypothetical protein